MAVIQETITILFSQDELLEILNIGREGMFLNLRDQEIINDVGGDVDSPDGPTRIITGPKKIMADLFPEQVDSVGR